MRVTWKLSQVHGLMEYSLLAVLVNTTANEIYYNLMFCDVKMDDFRTTSLDDDINTTLRFYNTVPHVFIRLYFRAVVALVSK